MFANFKKNRQIKRIKKELTERERAIFEYIYDHETGVTKNGIERATGYKLSGWVLTKFKNVGVNVKTKNKRYYIDSIEG